MEHPIVRVTSFEIVVPYTLRVRFDDATEQVIDFEPVLAGEMLGALRDRRVFKALTLDNAAGTLAWPSGADFDPATLHDWPDHAAELAVRARDWLAAAA